MQRPVRPVSLLLGGFIGLLLVMIVLSSKTDNTQMMLYKTLACGILMVIAYAIDEAEK